MDSHITNVSKDQHQQCAHTTLHFSYSNIHCYCYLFYVSICSIKFYSCCIQSLTLFRYLGGSVPTPFIIAAAGKPVVKRQADQTFIAANGTVTANCGSASVFTLQNGQLISNGELVSAPLNAQSIPFAVSPATNAITGGRCCPSNGTVRRPFPTVPSMA